MRFLARYNNKEDYTKAINLGQLRFPHVCLVLNELIYGKAYEPTPDTESPLWFEAIEDLSVSFTKDIEYSMDNSEWLTLSANSSTPTILKGNKIYFRASNLIPAYGIGNFSITGKCNVGGQLTSMYNGDDMKEAFVGLFKKCTTIISASKLSLPTTLASRTLYGLFEGCSGLINSPAHPASELAGYCYSAMYEDCSSLVNVAKLPAIKGKSGCYQSMFNGCSSLTTSPEMALESMDFGCCLRMYEDCSNLRSVVISSKKLANLSCKWMFQGCSSLSRITLLATEIPDADTLTSWVNGVSSTGTFVKAAGVEIPTGTSGIPEGWTVEEVQV